MSMGEWQQLTLDGLIAQRAGGERDFGTAWRRVQAQARARGVYRPGDYRVKPPADDPDWLPFSAFWRRALEREWQGLAHADYAGLREMLEDGSSAVARTPRGPAKRRTRAAPVA